MNLIKWAGNLWYIFMQQASPGAINIKSTVACNRNELVFFVVICFVLRSMVLIRLYFGKVQLCVIYSMLSPVPLYADYYYGYLLCVYLCHLFMLARMLLASGKSLNLLIIIFGYLPVIPIFSTVCSQTRTLCQIHFSGQTPHDSVAFHFTRYMFM